MSMSAAVAVSNDTVVNSIAQELLFSGIKINKINSKLNIVIGRLIEINYFEEMQRLYL